MKLQKKLYSFLTVFFTLLLSISWAEDPVTWNVKSNHLGNQEYEVTITANLESGWHLYSQFLIPLTMLQKQLLIELLI